MEKNDNTEQQKNEMEEQTDFQVTVEKVSGKINYDKLIQQFGTQKITEELLVKFERITGKTLHPWLKRGIFFSHRGLDQFLDAYENGDPVFLYTGRGPSSDSMHLGHLIPFIFTKWMQDTFDCPLVIQLSDEEKYAFGKGKFEDLHKMGWENSKDIVSVGFKPEKTFIFSNRDYRLKCPSYEIFTSDLKVNASIKEVSKVFGFSEDGNVGMYDWPFYQSAASFSQAFPHIFGGRPAFCLIPCAIDQDPYFRLGRDLASRMHLLKTSTIYSTFLPTLAGDSKMSSSDSTKFTIFLNDSEKEIKQKINQAVSGSRGNGSKEDHIKFGGDVLKDVSCMYLRYFEMDDEKIKSDFERFSKGELFSSDMKNSLFEKVMAKLNEVRENRKNITDDYLNEFFAMKPIPLPKVKEKEKTLEQVTVEDFLNQCEIPYALTYHNSPSIDSDYIELKSRLEGTLLKCYLFHSQEKFYLGIYNYDTIFAEDKLKLLAKKMDLKKINLANNDTCKNLLKCEINFISLLGLVNDKEKKIAEVWIDELIPKNKKVNFSPCRSDCRITLSYDDMLKICNNLNVPAKTFDALLKK